jgi:hypothetical protein
MTIAVPCRLTYVMAPLASSGESCDPPPSQIGHGELHHPAPGGRLSQQVGIEFVDDPRAWQDSIEVLPLDAAALTTSIEPFEQKTAAGIQILPQASAVATDSKILEVAPEMLLHILHHGSASMRPQYVESHSEFLQLLTQPLALGLATHHKTAATTSRNASQTRGPTHNGGRC